MRKVTTSSAGEEAGDGRIISPAKVGMGPTAEHLEQR